MGGRVEGFRNRCNRVCSVLLNVVSRRVRSDNYVVDSLITVRLGH